MLINQLKILGWSVEKEEWEETLQLRINEELKERWLADGSMYRKLLSENSFDDHINKSNC